MTEDAKRSIQYLEAAKAAVLQQQSVTGEEKRQEELVRKMEKNLEKEQTSLEDSIELMTKNRRAEVETHYDKQVEKLENQIRRVQNKRERTKNKGMQSRMKDETADVRHENSLLKNEISRIFRQDQVPGLCNTWVFYALYYPRRPKELLFFLLCFLVFIGGLPALLYYLFLSGRSMLWLVLLYVVDVFIFGGLYLLVGSRTKARHDEALREGRKIRQHLAANYREIRAVQTGIRRDTNEDMYGLESYDEKREELERNKADILREKKQALDAFDGEMRENIRSEIMANNEERMTRLEEELQKAEEDLDKFQAQEQYWSRKLGEKFGGRLGTEFLEAGKLDQLMEAFRAGAANMTEAQEMVRENAEKRKNV